MRRLIFVVLSLAAFSAELGWTDSEEKATNNSTIPSQIAEYYRDHNFVASFSSESERGLLVYLSHTGLPAPFKSERLGRIYKLINKLDAQLMRIDPGMVIWPKMDQHPVRPELIRICDVQRDNDEIAVEVLVYMMDTETNFKLVSLYDESGGDEENIPSQEQRIQMAQMGMSASAPRKGIHKWMLTDGSWMKTEADIWLLDH